MDTFIVIARTLHFAACVSLVGVGVFECLIAAPALDVTADLTRRLKRLAWVSLALAVITGAGWIAGVAADMSGQDFGHVFGSDAPLARLQQLGAAQLKLIAAGLPVIAVGVTGASQGAVTNPPYVVGVAAKVAAALSLFRSGSDGGETELMLDRNGNVRVRRTASDLAPPETLAADALTVARFAGSAPNHAGHGG